MFPPAVGSRYDASSCLQCVGSCRLTFAVVYRANEEKTTLSDLAQAYFNSIEILDINGCPGKTCILFAKNLMQVGCGHILLYFAGLWNRQSKIQRKETGYSHWK